MTETMLSSARPASTDSQDKRIEDANPFDATAEPHLLCHTDPGSTPNPPGLLARADQMIVDGKPELSVPDFQTALTAWLAVGLTHRLAANPGPGMTYLGRRPRC